MPKPIQTYRSPEIEVTFEPALCIHAAVCVRGLPAVFDPKARPWIRPDAAEAERVIEVVGRCPTGALRVHRLDSTHAPSAGTATNVAPDEEAVGGPVDATAAEPGTAPVVVTVQPNGPLLVTGAVSLRRADGTVVREDTRFALCRCGQSANKPFCDGSHKTGFTAD